MSKSSPRTFASDFRQFFFRGMAVLLPSVLTIWIVVQAYKFVDEKVAEPINQITRVIVIRAVPVVFRDELKRPDWYVVTDEEVESERSVRASSKLPKLSDDGIRSEIRRKAFKGWWDQHRALDLIGVAIAVVLFYLAGRIFGGFLGRRIQNRFEKSLARVPVFKQVYPYVKQIVDFLLGERQIEFRRVALIQYPREGIWTIGFITGQPSAVLETPSGRHLVTILIPTSPAPFTGFTVMVPREDVVELDITIEEALRFTVSGGVLVPGASGEEAAEAIKVFASSRDADDNKEREPDAG